MIVVSGYNFFKNIPVFIIRYWQQRFLKGVYGLDFKGINH